MVANESIPFADSLSPPSPFAPSPDSFPRMPSRQTGSLLSAPISSAQISMGNLENDHFLDIATCSFRQSVIQMKSSPLLRFHGRLHFDQTKMRGRQLDVVPPRILDLDSRRIRKISSYRSTCRCSNSFQQTKRILLRLQNRVNDETR